MVTGHRDTQRTGLQQGSEGFQRRHPCRLPLWDSRTGKRTRDVQRLEAGGKERGAVGLLHTRDCIHGALAAGYRAVVFLDWAESLLATACPGRPRLTVVRFLHPRESVGLGVGGSTSHALRLLTGHTSG